MAEAARQAAAEARSMENELTRPLGVVIQPSNSGASQPATPADTDGVRSREDDAIFRISEATHAEPSLEESPLTPGWSHITSSDDEALIRASHRVLRQMERAEVMHEQETEALILTEERLRKADDAEKGRALLQNLLAAQHHLEVFDKDTEDMLRARGQHLDERGGGWAPEVSAAAALEYVTPCGGSLAGAEDADLATQEAYTLTDDEDMEGLIAACHEVERRVVAGGRQDAQHAQHAAP